MSSNTTALPNSITASMETVTRDTTFEIFTIIQLTYGIPSTLLIIFFVFFLGFGKKYSNSFYRLVQFDLLVMWNFCLIPFCLLCIFYCCLCNALIPGSITDVYIRNDTLMKTSYISVMVRAMNLTAIFSAIYFVLLILVGLTTSKVVTWKIQAASITNGGIGKKLNKIAATYGFIYSGILAWSLLNTFNSNFKFLPTFVTQISTNLLPFASDMMTLALPYILMIHDTNVKQDILGRVPVSRTNSRIVSSSFVISR
ncbi:hypothetical protein B9Z55_018013 [Caenorhabditis nigoni]|uniref:Serpentine receptor class gamma n=1 Tax=Caenorhabditis nigoni TaxID=1611254 RepID=A0A2G5TC62_9PELO|nr:hypothetical protein B9Z55_018013 [Caenorhabditis nigoni]